ncbi:hypothetical protein ADUPG1_000364, partial [Aduncisulcus paluster]
QKSEAQYIIPNGKEEEDISFSFCGTSVTDCDHGQCYLRGCTEKGADIVLKTTTGEKFRIEVKILQGISHIQIHSCFDPVFDDSEVSDVISSKSFSTDGITRPVMCVPLYSTILFDVSSGVYPMYASTSLLNDNPSYDTGYLEDIESAMLNQLSTTLVGVTFNQSGHYVFSTSVDTYKQMFLLVSEYGEGCPSNYISSTNSDSLVTFNFPQVIDSTLLLTPNWTLIIVCTLVALLIVILLIGGFYLFSRVLWGDPIFNEPSYRLNTKFQDYDDFASKGSNVRVVKRTRNTGIVDRKTMESCSKATKKRDPEDEKVILEISKAERDRMGRNNESNLLPDLNKKKKKRGHYDDFASKGSNVRVVKRTRNTGIVDRKTMESCSKATKKRDPEDEKVILEISKAERDRMGRNNESNLLPDLNKKKKKRGRKNATDDPENEASEQFEDLGSLKKGGETEGSEDVHNPMAEPKEGEEFPIPIEGQPSDQPHQDAEHSLGDPSASHSRGEEGEEGECGSLIHHQSVI